MSEGTQTTNKKQTRSTLESYFKTGLKPTEGNFSDLIVSGINQEDDGITVSTEKNIGFGDTTPNSKVSIKSNTSVQLTGTVTTKDSSFVGTAGFTKQLSVGDILEISETYYSVAGIMQGGTTFTTVPDPATAIGTATPVKKIAGAFSVNSNSGDSILHVGSNKNVGINTNNPLEALEVSGTVKATQFSGSAEELTNIPSGKLSGDINLTGNTISAQSFTGSGTGLINIPINGLTAGDIDFPSNSITAKKFVGNGEGLTNLPSGELSGDINLSENTILAQSFTGSGEGLTNIPANELTSGDINLVNNTIQAQSFIGDGSQLTGINSNSNGIQNFAVADPIIAGGESTYLTWTVTGVDHVTLTFLKNFESNTVSSTGKTPGIAKNQIKYPVNPDTSKIYTLTAYDKSNNIIDQSQLQISVIPPVDYFIAHTTTSSIDNIVKEAAEIFNLKQLNQSNVTLLTKGLVTKFPSKDIPSALNKYYTSLGFVWTNTNLEWVMAAMPQK